MGKPKKKTQEYLDYHECRDFLQEKYGYDERDYAGKYKYLAKVEKDIKKEFGSSWWNKLPKEFNDKEKQASKKYDELSKNAPEYLDFWHWVVDNHDVHNGCYIHFSKFDNYDDLCDEKWIQEIYKHYIDEFADENGDLTMYVSW